MENGDGGPQNSICVSMQKQAGYECWLPVIATMTLSIRA